VRFDVLTLHPQMVAGPLGCSMVGRAQEKGLVRLGVHDIREHGHGKHRQVDDSPYGGGAGMVMRVDVVSEALNAVRTDAARVILMTPTGQPFTQRTAERYAKLEHLILVCGHYEGIDDRISHCIDEELSLGDFVLTGGEVAAVAVIDATARLLPGVLGNASSAVHESFAAGLLEHPHYTRPREWEGHEVPEILLSGHHARIDAWRLERSIALTRARRPDLLREWEVRQAGNANKVGESVDGSPKRR
jgi:tRNA (guanine37-N1)-methyltransferase